MSRKPGWGWEMWPMARRAKQEAVEARAGPVGIRVECGTSGFGGLQYSVDLLGPTARRLGPAGVAQDPVDESIAGGEVVLAHAVGHDLHGEGSLAHGQVRGHGRK